MKRPFPEEFGNYRIGTPVNADLGEVLWQWRAFDMGMLAGANALSWNLNPEIQKTVQAGGYTAEAQDTWSVAVDSSASLSFSAFSTVQASFHMARSSNSARRNAGQTITAVARQSGQVSIVNATRDLLLKCATEDFTARMRAIFDAAAQAGDGSDAAASQALESALAEFYTRYGTGFISSLRLGAVGIFEGSVVSSSRFDQTHAGYGGGVSIGGLCGGFAAGAEFASMGSQADADATLRCEGYGMPPGSAPAQWAESMMQQFAGQQLSKMASLSAWQPAELKLAAPHAVAPKMLERKPASEVPKFPGGDIDTQVKNMKLREFQEAYKAEHGKPPDAAKYEAWLKDLKATARKGADALAQVVPAPHGEKA